MNEKLISELWELATCTNLPRDGESKENILTFATLIINECVIISRNADHDDNCVDFGHMAIMKHFELVEPNKDYWNNHYQS